MEKDLEPAADGAAADPSPRLPQLLLRFGGVGGLLLADLWSKSAIFARFSGDEAFARDESGHPHVPVLGEWLRWRPSLNPGAIEGLGSNMPYLLVGLRVIAVMVLAVLVARAVRGRGAFTFALILLLAGAAGNLHDNLFGPRPSETSPFGAVRDFIDVYFTAWDRHFPTFNVADLCISAGVLLLLQSGLRRHHPRPSPAEADAVPGGRRVADGAGLL